MAVSDGYLAYVLERLECLGPVAARRMFGGAGLYFYGVFFGLVADDTLYLKTDDANRGDYEAAGMGPFRPYGTYAMSYHEVPAGVLDDGAKLLAWAEKAVEAASRKGAEKGASRKAAPRRRG